MTKFKLNPAPTFADGLIIVERPHQGPVRVWTAFDEADALKRTQAAADQSRSDTSDFDLTTFDGAIEWNGHDLSRQAIIRLADLDLDDCHYRDDLTEVGKAALYLEWISETEEEEEAA